MTKNPYTEYPRNLLADQYRQARRSRTALANLYMWELIDAGRGNRLSDSEMADPGVLEAAAAVAVADALGEDWPIEDLLRSSAQLPTRARLILADWLHRSDPRKMPSHQLSPADHVLRRAEQLYMSIAKKDGVDESAIRRVAKEEGLRVTTLRNYIKGVRGSSRRMDRR